MKKIEHREWLRHKSHFTKLDYTRPGKRGNQTALGLKITVIKNCNNWTKFRRQQTEFSEKKGGRDLHRCPYHSAAKLDLRVEITETKCIDRCFPPKPCAKSFNTSPWTRSRSRPLALPYRRSRSQCALYPTAPIGSGTRTQIERAREPGLLSRIDVHDLTGSWSNGLRMGWFSTLKWGAVSDVSLGWKLNGWDSTYWQNGRMNEVPESELVSGDGLPGWPGGGEKRRVHLSPPLHRVTRYFAYLRTCVPKLVTHKDVYVIGILEHLVRIWMNFCDTYHWGRWKCRERLYTNSMDLIYIYRNKK